MPKQGRDFWNGKKMCFWEQHSVWVDGSTGSLELGLEGWKSGLWARSLCLGDWELVAVGEVDKEKGWVLFWRNVFMQLWKAGLQRLKRDSSILTEGKGDKAWATAWFWRPPRGQISTCAAGLPGWNLHQGWISTIFVSWRVSPMPSQGSKQVWGKIFLLAGAGSTHHLPAFLGNQLAPRSEGEGVEPGHGESKSVCLMAKSRWGGAIVLAVIFSKSA